MTVFSSSSSSPRLSISTDSSTMYRGKQRLLGLTVFLYISCNMSNNPHAFAPSDVSLSTAKNHLLQSANHNKLTSGRGRGTQVISKSEYFNMKAVYRCPKKYRSIDIGVAGVGPPALCSTSVSDADDDVVLLEQKQRLFLDDFRPETKPLWQSLMFYVRYVLSTIKRNRKAKRALKIKKKEDKKIWSKGDGNKKGNGDGMSFKETLSQLQSSLLDLIHLAGYDNSLMFPSFTALILGALFTSVVPHFYSNCITCVVNSGLDVNGNGNIVRALLGLGITSTLMALTTGVRGSLFWVAGSRCNFGVRTKLHRNLLRQETAFFDATETGILLSRLNNDVNKIGNVVSFHVNIVLRQSAQFLFGSLYLWRMDVRLSALAFAGIGVIWSVSKLYGDFARELGQDVQDRLATGSAVAETAFAMSETVRAFDGLDVETRRYEAAQRNALTLEEVQAWAYGTHKFVSDTLRAAMQLTLLGLCWTMGRRGRVDPATLTTFLFYVNFVLESSSEVGDQWAKIQGAIGASTSVFELIRRIPKIMDPFNSDNNNNMDSTTSSSTSTTTQQQHQPIMPIIDMRNMTVTYYNDSANNTTDTYPTALKDVQLQIYPGDKVAIVGRSGSGKSSMLRTLLRFYDPVEGGECKIDGRSLRDYTRRELAKKVVVVEQEPHLFPMTLLENVLYGMRDNDDVDDDARRRNVGAALQLAGLPVTGEHRNNLGLALDTRVGEGGRTLSGGQRQRVAIARALVREPDVLLLDEPTAALDSESEKTVVKALRSAMERTRCMLMVTHRFSPIRSLGVNKVIVLERGEIVEMGHPEDLLAKEGSLFALLAKEQGIFATSTAGSGTGNDGSATSSTTGSYAPANGSSTMSIQ